MTESPDIDKIKPIPHINELFLKDNVIDKNDKKNDIEKIHPEPDDNITETTKLTTSSQPIIITTSKEESKAQPPIIEITRKTSSPLQPPLNANNNPDEPFSLSVNNDNDTIYFQQTICGRHMDSETLNKYKRTMSLVGSPKKQKPSHSYSNSEFNINLDHLQSYDDKEPSKLPSITEYNTRMVRSFTSPRYSPQTLSSLKDSKNPVFDRLDSLEESISELFLENSEEEVVSKSRLLPKALRSRILLILTLGLLSACVMVVVDVLSSLLLELRNKFSISSIHAVGGWNLGYGLSLFLWLFSSLFLALCAVFITQWFAPQATGSGVSELRAILSGKSLHNYLSLPTLLTKTAGLILTIGSGIPVGREGPFLHISSCFGNLLHSINFFKDTDRVMVLNACCAAGVSTAFNAPFGGILFSIEVTSTYFMIENYFMSVLCACLAFFVGYGIELVIYNNNEVHLFPTNFPQTKLYNYREILFFLLLSIFCSLIGWFFLKFHYYFIKFRRKYQPKIFGKNPYIICTIIVLSFSTIIWFLGKFARNRLMIEILPTMLSNGSLYHDTDWNAGIGVISNLILFLCIFLIFTAMCITLQLPTGVFMPVITYGAVIGRLMAEVINLASSDENAVNPGGYAVIGAAAFAASITRTFSSAIIIFELTGQLNFFFPTILATTVAIFLSNFFSNSIYENILTLQNIFLLPPDPKHIRNVNQLMASDAMEPNIGFVERNPTEEDLKNTLIKYDFDTFPVVYSKDTMILLGEISRYDLEEYYKFRFSSNDSEEDFSPLTPQISDDNIMFDLASRIDKDLQNTKGKASPLAIRINSFRQNSPKDEEPKTILDTISTKKNIEKIHLYKEPWLRLINQSPLQIIAQTPLRRVYFMFWLLRPTSMYITSFSRLVGRILRKDLVKYARQGYLGELDDDETKNIHRNQRRYRLNSFSVPNDTSIDLITQHKPPKSPKISDSPINRNSPTLSIPT